MFINSRFFLAVIMLLIGITYTYIYLEAPKLFDTRKIVMDFNRIAEAKEVGRGSDTLANLKQEDSGVQGKGIAEPSKGGYESLITAYFPTEANDAINVFKCESHLDPKKESGVDVMSDGRTFSVGLAQINLTVSEVGGVDCTKAFEGRNKYAKVVDEVLYETCKSLAKDPEVNLQTAKKKYNNRGNTWGAWEYCARQNNLL